MTKHLIALVRLAGRSYRILITFAEFIDRFPLDSLITAIELFTQWAERQEPPTQPQTPAGPSSAADTPQFQIFVDLQTRHLAAQETMNAHLSLIAANTRPLATSPLFIRRKIYKQEALEMLGISDRTYDRRKAEGRLKPRGMGHDFFYPEDLEEAIAESRRTGRV